MGEKKILDLGGLRFEYFVRFECTFGQQFISDELELADREYVPLADIGVIIRRIKKSVVPHNRIFYKAIIYSLALAN